jgi:hypothetical protein
MVAELDLIFFGGSLVPRAGLSATSPRSFLAVGFSLLSLADRSLQNVKSINYFESLKRSGSSLHSMVRVLTNHHRIVKMLVCEDTNQGKWGKSRRDDAYGSNSTRATKKSRRDDLMNQG